MSKVDTWPGYDKNLISRQMAANYKDVDVAQYIKRSRKKMLDKILCDLEYNAIEKTFIAGKAVIHYRFIDGSSCIVSDHTPTLVFIKWSWGKKTDYSKMVIWTKEEQAERIKSGLAQRVDESMSNLNYKPKV